MKSTLGWLRALAAPLLTALIFALIFRKVPFERFVHALAEANLVRFFAALLPFSVLYFALDTLVLTAVTRWFHGRLDFKELLPVRAVDYLVSIVNHKLSQGAIVLYLSRKLKVPVLEVASTMVFLDLLQKTHLVLWATVGMLLMAGAVPRGLYFVPAAAVALWSLFLLYVRSKFAPNWRLLRTFKLAGASRYAQVLLLKAPLLLASVCVHQWALTSFGIEVPFLRLLATLPIIFLAGALPVTVAHLGTTQAAWLFFHGNASDAASLLAYSLAAHLTFMLANAALGASFLPRAYRELFSESQRAVPAPLPEQAVRWS